VTAGVVRRARVSVPCRGVGVLRSPCSIRLSGGEGRKGEWDAPLRTALHSPFVHRGGWHEPCAWKGVTVSPSPQSKDEENEKLHKLREYARDFRRQHTTDAEQFDWDSDDGDYGLAIGRLVVT
jgi:hypothetical protein